MLRRRLVNALLRWLSERPLRHLHTVPPRAARGLLDRVYGQVARDYIVAGPITVHSASPELAAGLWAYGRETVLAATALDRGVKEVIAAAVSVANRCPYCRDMHTSMAHSAGAHDLAAAVLALEAAGSEDGGEGGSGGGGVGRGDGVEPVIEWARAGTAGPSGSGEPPFRADQLPEAIGTAVFFHYINRVVNVFFEDTALRLPLVGAVLTDRATRGFGLALRPRMRVDVAPGESLDLVPRAPLPDDLAWADHPTIGPAVAGWAAALEAAARRHVPTAVRAAVVGAVAGWKGEDAALGDDWLAEHTAGLSEAHRPVAELALLAALASYRVTEARVRAFAEVKPGDEALLVTVAWSASLAAREVGRRLAVSTVPAGRVPAVPAG